MADGSNEIVEEDVSEEIADDLVEVVAGDAVDELASADIVDGGAEVAPGDAVEGYWPEDDTWLPATVDEVHPDGSLRIIWGDSSTQSEVPADYIRAPGGEVLEPPTKRARISA